MPKNTDHLKKSITKHLKPLLVKEGFCRIKPKVFVRVRGDLMDIIFLDFGRTRELFYLYFASNLLISKSPESILYTYDLGNRYGKNHYDDIQFLSKTLEETEKSILSLLSLIKNDVFPWFNSINSIEDYVIEYISRKQLPIGVYNGYIEWLFSLLGKDYQPLYKTDNPFPKEPVSKERSRSIINSFSNQDIDTNYHEQLRKENIKINKLEKCFV